MAFNPTKAVQGGINFAAFGTQVGNELRKRYGDKAPVIGGVAGLVTGATLSGLSDTPDTNMAEGIYDEAISLVESDTMRGARSASQEAGAAIANEFARRGINKSDLAASVSGVQQGRIHQAAQESLTPLRTELAVKAADDKLQAKRIGEFEERKGWMDTLLGVGMAAKNIADKLAAESEKDNSDAPQPEVKEPFSMFKPGYAGSVYDDPETKPVASGITGGQQPSQPIDSSEDTPTENPYNPDPNNREQAVKENVITQRDELPPEKKETLEEQDKTPTTKAQLMKWIQANPEGMNQVLQSSGEIGRAILKPVVGPVIASLAAQLGPQFVALMKIYNKY